MMFKNNTIGSVRSDFISAFDMLMELWEVP
jgi:hypothetical protein